MGLDDLIDDGKPQACAALKSGLQRLENLGALFGVKSDAGIPKGNTQPERKALNSDAESSAGRHGAECVVAEIPKNLLNLVGVDSSAQFSAVKCPYDLVLILDFGLFLEQCKGFVQQTAHVCILKFVALLARVVQKVGDDMVQALRFAADDVDQVLLILLER